MKKLLNILLLLITFNLSSQTHVLHTNEPDWYNGEELYYNNFKILKPLACPSNSIISSGYPAWTNYWAGYMVKINNISTCNVTINCFETRFQGTTGYRIYTKTGTFVGFELNALAWILVGTVNNLTGLSTIAPTPIPIAVNITIPPLSSQSFYLTRTDNVVVNRHLYVTGVGIAGTTVYSSDANIQITEGSYIDPFFALLNVGTRRPSLDVYYNINCNVLPIELIKFEVKNINDINKIEWKIVTDDIDELTLERSIDGYNWQILKDYYNILNSFKENTYYDVDYKKVINYYRLKYYENGIDKFSNIIVIDNRIINKTIIKVLNILGQEVGENYDGIKIIYYSDGEVVKNF